MVLYITFLALATFLIFSKMYYPAILFFTLVLFLTKFSSNMIVILGISILATNLLDVFRIFSFRNIEGMDNK